MVLASPTAVKTVKPSCYLATQDYNLQKSFRVQGLSLNRNYQNKMHFTHGETPTQDWYHCFAQSKTKMAADDSRVGVQEVTLRARNHSQALNDGLWELFRANTMLDVTLSCHGKSLKVHRLLLAIFSPVLKGTLLSTSLEKDVGGRRSSIEEGGEKTLLLSLDYVTAEEASYMQYLVEFLYRGTVTLPKEGLESLLQTARVLAVQGLVEAIEEFIDGEMARVKGPAGVSNETPHGHKRLTRKRKPVQSVTMYDEFGSVHHKQSTEDHTLGPRSTADLSRVGMVRRSSHRALEQTGPCKTSALQEAGVKQHPKLKSDSGSLSEQSDTEVRCRGKEGSDLEEEYPNQDEPSHSADSSGAAADEESPLELALEKIDTRKRQRRKPLQPKKVVREPEKDKGETRRIFIKEYCKIWRQTRPVMRCHYCDYETQDKGSYKSHIARHDPSAERFQCDICGKSFRSKNGIRGHIRSHGDPDCLHKCTHCDFQTPQKWNWLKHLAVIHKVDPDGNPLLENIKCSQCQFQCVANHQLKAHVLRHHTLDKPFKCTECDYAAVIKHELNKHISISHKKERSYACDICSFRSQTQGGLTRHKRTHTGEKPFKCELCEMCYADRGKLKVHILRHAREKKKQYSIIGRGHDPLST